MTIHIGRVVGVGRGLRLTVQVQHFDRIGRRTHLRTIPVRRDGSFTVQGCGCLSFQVIYTLRRVTKGPSKGRYGY